MSEQVGFLTMGSAASGGPVPEIGIGMLGYAFMGKAHSNAFRTIPYMIQPLAAMPKMVALCGRNRDAVTAAATRFGYEKVYLDWREMLKDDSIQLFDNGGPNNIHAEPTIAAAEAGKHVLCEKPLGRSAHESKLMLDAVRKAGVKHMCAFNYRFVPAVRQAKALLERGALGRIFHFRARYLQEWGNSPDVAQWRYHADNAGSGALGDLGAHIIDLARFLIGEPTEVSALTATFITERDDPSGAGGRLHVDVDDAFEAVVRFANGAVGTLEATRFAPGRKNHNVFEINGELGSIAFNLENMNNLEVHLPDHDPKDVQGFRNVLVSESYHPFWQHWWPQGHIIGWEHTFVHEVNHLLEAIVGKHEVAPYGADFVDGYRNAVICDAIIESAREGRRVEISYHD